MQVVSGVERKRAALQRETEPATHVTFAVAAQSAAEVAHADEYFGRLCVPDRTASRPTSNSLCQSSQASKSLHQGVLRASAAGWAHVIDRDICL